ncbi:HDOD domain-containing protein [candidate division KSB1 bacterium]|nr:HDOD domain-containing protein [candidate division KSB1 bacterium]
MTTNSTNLSAAPELVDLLASSDPARRSEIQHRILSSGDLPTLPTIAIEVSRLATSPLTGMSDIVRIIRNDPPLTAKILRVANSAFYGMPRRIESLNMALVVLGMREINNLVTCISVLRAFPGRGEAGFDRNAFWEHSAGTGEIARVIASRLHLRLHGVEFTAGLLHDVGKIVLDQHFHSEFMESLRVASAEGLSTAEAERRVLGVDHAEIGAWLAEAWALPPAITECIRYHHQPTLSPDSRTLTAVVHMANLFTTAMLGSESQRARLTERIALSPAWNILAEQHPELIAIDVSGFAADLQENIERARDFIRMATE